MKIFVVGIQILVALSVDYVWTFRFHNVINEFKQFGLSDLARNLVGASKISLAALLLAGIWFPSIVLYASLLMGSFMLAAQYFHFKNKSAMQKRVPSFFLLIACIFLVMAKSNII